MSDYLDRAAAIALDAAENLLASVDNYAYPEKGYSSLASILHALATIESTRQKFAPTQEGQKEPADNKAKTDTASLLKVINGKK